MPVLINLLPGLSDIVQILGLLYGRADKIEDRAFFIDERLYFQELLTFVNESDLSFCLIFYLLLNISISLLICFIHPRVVKNYSLIQVACKFSVEFA